MAALSRNKPSGTSSPIIEQNLERVLDLLTTAPPPKVESFLSGSALQMTNAKAHTFSLRRIIETENIVGVGISEKISEGKAVGKLALTFYVERKVPLDDLDPDLAVPPTVPDPLSGPDPISTDVKV